MLPLADADLDRLAFAIFAIFATVAGLPVLARADLVGDAVERAARTRGEGLRLATVFVVDFFSASIKGFFFGMNISFATKAYCNALRCRRHPTCEGSAVRIDIVLAALVDVT
ncbi:MAG: hypothetical protein ACYCVM_06925 [Acidiferrobacter sp.]